MKSSYDILGSKEKSVAIIEETDNPKKIAQQIIKEHKNVKSILMKLSERIGIERKRDYKFIMGDPNTEVIHKENYCRLKLDPQKVYFSGREGTERLRIAEMVKANEKILVMFSGVAPFAIIISKKEPSSQIVCVDINKEAIKYAKENVKLNKTQNIKNYCGDIRGVCKNLGNFDRILMPLPRKGYEYLDIAFQHCEKKCIIHLYGIGEEKNLFGNLERILKKTAKDHQKKIKIINERRVLPYAPRKWKVCIDSLILDQE